MKVLVTGANGFIGSHVVTAFLARGYEVRALVRPSADVGPRRWPAEVEVVRADLRLSRGLSDAGSGVDAIVHIAARMGGSEAQQFETTVGGTERLIHAMRGSGVDRFVLASSYSVYDWSSIEGELTEASPVVEDHLVERGPYTVAKVWQERVTRRLAAETGLDLTVVRPGFVWGRDHVWLSGMGQRYLGVHVVFGRSTLIPITHVENCADAFVDATVKDGALHETFNVVDGEPITTWRYTDEYLRRTGTPGRLLSVPYPAALAVSRLGAAVGRRIFGAGNDLPDLFVPARVEAQFKPLSFPNDKIRALGWRPRWRFEEALERSYGPPAGRHQART